MVEPRHAVDQVKKCSIQGCNADAVRSISGKKVEKAGMSISGDASKSVHLCHEHYKEFKKKTKSDRTFERLGWK